MTFASSAPVGWATEVIEVTRPAVTTTLAAAANALAIGAVAGTVTLVGMLLVRRVRVLGRAWLVLPWAVALALSAGEVVLRVLDLFDTRAATSMVEALGSQRVAAALARVVVLLVAAGLERFRHDLQPRERSVATSLLALVLVATVVLDMPGAPTALATGLRLAATLALIGGAAWLAVALHDRRPDLREHHLGALASLLVCVVVSIPLVAPPREPVGASEVATFADGRFDVTLSPAASGSNEVHVYVFDASNLPVVVRDGLVSVEGGSVVELLTAGGNHLVAYGVPLPDRSSWQLTIEGQAADGRTLATTLEVDRP